MHCAACNDFFGNPLTPDGIAFVREALTDGNGDPNVLDTWREFYADVLR